MTQHHWLFISPHRLHSHTDSRGPAVRLNFLTNSSTLCLSVTLFLSLLCTLFATSTHTHLKIASNALGPYPWFIWKAINQAHKSSASHQPRNPHENWHLFWHHRLLLFFLPAWHVSLVCVERRRLSGSNRHAKVSSPCCLKWRSGKKKIMTPYISSEKVH